jgi:periplasmic protein TonB
MASCSATILRTQLRITICSKRALSRVGRRPPRWPARPHLISNDPTTAMDSSVSAFVSPAHALRDPRRGGSVRPIHPLRSRFRPNGASVALTLSIICHLGLALLATLHFRPTSIAPELARAPLELLAADFEVLAETAEPPPSPTQAAVPANAPRVLAQSSVTHGLTPVAPVIPARAATAATEPEPEATTVNAAPESSTPHFTLTVGKTIGSTSAKISGSTLAPPAGGIANVPVSSASVDTPAKLRAGNLPAYTAAAITAGIEANVTLEIVVSETGVVTSARGLDHVGYGLDEAARQSVLGYRFTPALRSGTPVAVRMHWLMRFQLR